MADSTEFWRKEKMLNLIRKYPIWAVAAWGALLFIPFLGSVHLFDWDEINFAESAREMLVTGNYQQVQINYQPFTEKPPFFFWLQALSMKVFGVNEFAARFPNAITGIITLILIFVIGKRWYGERMAWLWVLLVTGSLTPHLYYKTGIIDPVYNLFIFGAVYQLFLYHQLQKSQHAWALGALLGLAIITKGPVAVVVLVLLFLSFLVSQRFKKFFQWKDLLFAVIAAFMVSALWFGMETIQHGPGFLMEFIAYQADLFLNPVAGHGQPWYYHPIVLLLGCFPASVIALPILIKGNKSEGPESMFRLFFWVVLILFSIVETKIVHYSSLCYLPLTFLAARQLEQASLSSRGLKLTQGVLVLIIGMVLSLVMLLLPFTDVWKADIMTFIKDDFARKCLESTGGWHAWEALFGAAFAAGVVLTFKAISQEKNHSLRWKVLPVFSLLIPTLLAVYARHVERYSQGPAIDFYQSLQGKEVYVETLGYKSYAQYFYSGVMPMNPLAKDKHWLLTGSLDRPAYFAIHAGEENDHINATMTKVDAAGGFVFYRREPNTPFSEGVVEPESGHNR